LEDQDNFKPIVRKLLPFDLINTMKNLSKNIAAGALLAATSITGCLNELLPPQSPDLHRGSGEKSESEKLRLATRQQLKKTTRPCHFIGEADLVMHATLAEGDLFEGMKIGPHLVCQDRERHLNGSIGVEAGVANGGNRAEQTVKFVLGHGYRKNSLSIGPTISSGMKRTSVDVDDRRHSTEIETTVHAIAGNGVVARYCFEGQYDLADTISCITLGAGTEIPLTHRDKKGVRASGNFFFGVGF
jgi:hypothetical protein